MVSRRVLLGATLLCLVVGALGAFLYLRQRDARCASTPTSPNLITVDSGPGLPTGWARGANGVELRYPALDGEGFDLDGDGRALQLLGIGNYVQTPPVPASPGQRLCFSGFTLTDSARPSATRARLVFVWQGRDSTILREDYTLWQPVVLWTPEAPPRDWTPLGGSFVAPEGASSLAVRVEPASDDRIYLDLMAMRQGGAELAALASPPYLATAPTLPPGDTTLTVTPWPLGRQAAVAFTFDWETAMGGLVHSRSVGDPHVDEDYLQRAMRMREGITTTLQLFEPLGIRATYYATGYNFLRGNTERRQFLDNPTFTWADSAHGWVSDRWVTTPWFADDPFGTLQSHPAWYFGDLVEPLLRAGHTIQSHTFSHLHGGLADINTWKQDLQTWNTVAAERGVAPATSLAFPWSSSAGMSDTSWDTVEQAGITSVTRLSDQAQYNLFPANNTGLVIEPRCRWVPGREGRILACPDFYLTPDRADLALRQVEQAVAVGGMIDLWAHTEEVVTPAQLDAWGRVARTVAEDGRLWVAPLPELAAWQQAIAQLRVERLPDTADGAARYRLQNPSAVVLAGVSLRLPTGTTRVAVSEEDLEQHTGRPDRRGWWPDAGLAILDLIPGQTVEVLVWP